jgi:hypothetical protein
MIKLIKKKYIQITLSLLLLVLAIIYLLSHNLNLLYIITEGSDKPSKTYYWTIERIYKIAERKEDIGHNILRELKSGKNLYLHNIYIQLIGIIGVKDAVGYLNRAFVDCQNDKNNQSKIYHIVDSFGLIGNEKIVPFLEKLLDNYEKYDLKLTRYSIARALFLITGKSYKYISKDGKYSKITVSDELQKAREVIVSSKGRKRTFDEMLILDKLLRPPGWEGIERYH